MASRKYELRTRKGEVVGEFLTLENAEEKAQKLANKHGDIIGVWKVTEGSSGDFKVVTKLPE